MFKGCHLLESSGSPALTDDTVGKTKRVEEEERSKRCTTVERFFGSNRLHSSVALPVMPTVDAAHQHHIKRDGDSERERAVVSPETT